MDFNPFKSGATQTVQENKFEIPEDVPATERTAFHGAAAAAHKAGKKSFNFAGKSHPVTMKKDTANAIADQKEGYYKDKEIKAQDKASGAKPVAMPKKEMKKTKNSEAKGGGKEGDVEMNPKMEKESVKESRIRSALKSVLSEKKNEKTKHSPNSDEAEKMSDKIKGQGAKDMMKGAEDEIAKGPEAHLDEPAMLDKDAVKMTSNVPKSKARGNDNMNGETKIKPGGTPVKNPGAMKNEAILNAYNTMYAEEK